MDFTFTEEQATVGIAYPLDRYFLWAKHNELTLGPATAQLAQLGATYSEGLP